MEVWHFTDMSHLNTRLIPAFKHVVRALPVLVATTLLSACMMAGPDYRTPESALPEQWRAASSAGQQNAVALAQWWRQFDDSQLDALITQALFASPDLRSAQARLRESRARVGVAEAAGYPSLNASADARRTENAGPGSCH